MATEVKLIRCECGAQATCWRHLEYRVLCSLAEGTYVCPDCHTCSKRCTALHPYPSTPAPVIAVDANTHIEHHARKGPFAYVFRDGRLKGRHHKRADGVWQYQSGPYRAYSATSTVDNHPKAPLRLVSDLDKALLNRRLQSKSYRPVPFDSKSSLHPKNRD